MAKQTPAQARKIHEIMHGFKHGTLKAGAGKGAPKVTDRKQAIAIALRQIGAGQPPGGGPVPPWVMKGSQRRDVFPAMRMRR
jgi:hypothetical protein